jgi:hypothetical protein
MERFSHSVARPSTSHGFKTGEVLNSSHHARLNSLRPDMLALATAGKSGSRGISGNSTRTRFRCESAERVRCSTPQINPQRLCAGQAHSLVTGMGTNRPRRSPSTVQISLEATRDTARTTQGLDRCEQTQLAVDSAQALRVVAAACPPHPAFLGSRVDAVIQGAKQGGPGHHLQ